MRRFVFTIISLMATAIVQAEGPAMLERLDSIMSAADHYESLKTQRIANLRSLLATQFDIDSRYELTSSLAEEFKTYNVDSALRYAQQALDLSTSMADQQRSDADFTRLSFILAASGLLKEAKDAIDAVNPANMSRENLKGYYSQMMYLLSHLGDYAKSTPLGNEYHRQSRAYRDSLMAVTQPSDPDYLIYMGWKLSGTDSPEKSDVVRRLKEAVDNSAMETRDDSRRAYILACLLLEQGDVDGYVDYLALSAIGDIKTVNRDIASLEDLSRRMLAVGDIDRAYRYVDYASNAASLYPNRLRSLAMADLQKQIHSAYLEKSARQERRLAFMLSIVAIMSALLIALVVKIRRHAVRLRRYGADLAKANAELAQANYVKEEYIGYAFAQCSSYIAQLKNFKKLVNRKCKAKQFDEIRAMTETNRGARDDMKEFYRSFDSVFLSIYPDFIEQFNSRLPDQKKVTPREGEMLNNELRIYALERLGITDSIKIASILHCSPQTVYNYRSQKRSSLKDEPKQGVKPIVKTYQNQQSATS